MKNLYVNNRIINRRIELIRDGKIFILFNNKWYMFNIIKIELLVIGFFVNVLIINIIWCILNWKLLFVFVVNVI